MDDEQLRIRGYLVAQAAKLSVADLIDRVRADQARLIEAAGAIPADRRFDRSAPGAWSANQVLAHVVAYGAAVAAGIDRAVAGQTPAPPGPDTQPIDPPRRAIADWCAALTADRDRLFAGLARARGDEHLDTRWPHGAFGDLNWREWLLFLRLHDVDHTGQLRQIADTFGGDRPTQ